ncbi:hypothetical protein [Streptomyces sp. KR80]|uniref:hypothetical protein n=1 Tax=Streptomyces sp. KR80 TaxID=3457426 RepID=UPI003FD66486
MYDADRDPDNSGDFANRLPFRATREDRRTLVVVHHGPPVADPLVAGQSFPALVWDERYGWRTATSRRHPIGKDTGTAPEGEGIRYLGTSRKPGPAELLEALADGRKGSKRPKVWGLRRQVAGRAVAAHPETLTQVTRSPR